MYKKTHVAYRDATSRILSTTTYTSTEEELRIVLFKNLKDPSKIGDIQATLTFSNIEKYEELKHDFYRLLKDKKHSIIVQDKYKLIHFLAKYKLFTEEIQKDCYALLNLPYYSWVSSIEKTETTKITFSPVRSSKIQKIIFDEKDFSTLAVKKTDSQLEAELKATSSASSSAPTLEELGPQVESELKSTASELIEGSESSSSLHAESKLRSAFLALYKTPKESDFEPPAHPFLYQDITLNINDPLDFETIKDKLSKYAFTLSRAEYPELEVRTVFIVEFLNTIAEYLVNVDEIRETLKISYPDLSFKEWINPLRKEGRYEQAIQYVVKDDENEFLFDKLTLEYEDNDSLSVNFHINPDCKLSTHQKLSHLLTLKSLIKDTSELSVKSVFKEKCFTFNTVEKDIDLIRTLRTTTLYQILPHCTEVEKFILGDGPKHIPLSIKEIVSIRNRKYTELKEKTDTLGVFKEMTYDPFYSIDREEDKVYYEGGPSVYFGNTPSFADDISQPDREIPPYPFAPSYREDTPRSSGSAAPALAENASQPEREVTPPHSRRGETRFFGFAPALTEDISLKETEEAATQELLKCIK